MKFIKRQKTEACALHVNKKNKKVAGQHPSHIDFLFIDCYNSNPSYRIPATNKTTQAIPQINKEMYTHYNNLHSNSPN